jgi:DNA-binding CsgD family transcriptional regulator
MHIVSSLVNENLVHVSIHNPAPPLTEAQVVGRSVMEFCPPGQREIVYDRLTHCLATGEPQSYRVRVDLGNERILFLVRAKRVVIAGVVLAHCIATKVPPEVDDLAEADVEFLRLLASREQKEVARLLGITVGSVSRKERQLRRQLRLESRHELRIIAQELEEES